MKLFWQPLWIAIALLTACNKPMTINGQNSNSMGSDWSTLGGVLKVKSTGPTLGLTCSPSSYNASLYPITSAGIRETTPIATSLVSETGEYTFPDAKVTQSDQVSYVIEVIGCGNYFARYVTGYDRTQDADHATTLVSYVSGSAINRQAGQISRVEMRQIFEKLTSLTGDKVLDVFNSIKTNDELQKFMAQSFGDSNFITKIEESAPRLLNWEVSKVLNEGQLYQLTAVASHWSEAKPAYEWYWDGKPISNEPSVTFTPSPNSQGIRKLQIRIGRRSSESTIDTTKQYMEFVQEVDVANTIPPQPPEVVLSSQTNVVNHHQLSLKIKTGPSLSSCRSFDALAVTLEKVAPPESQFTISCQNSNEQLLSDVSLKPEDGLQTVYLWAIDASKAISKEPSSVNVILDRGLPALSLTQPTQIAGASTYSIQFSAQDAASGIQSVAVSYRTASSSSYTAIATLTSTPSSLNWSVPSVNSTEGQIKITATDGAGNERTVESNLFVIDSTPPVAPTLTLTSPANTNSQAIQLTPSNCGGGSHLIFTTGAAPNASDSGWVACTTSSLNATLPDQTNGVRNLTAWTKDAVGNISTSGTSVSLYFDNVAPVLAITAPTAIQGNVSRTVSFTATELNADATRSFTLSVFNGSSWSTLGTVAHSAGPSSNASFSVTGTIPNVNVTNAKFRVSFTDLAGNTGTVESSAFTIDSTIPTISSLVLAGGSSTTALPTILVSLTASDPVSNGVNSNLTHMQFSESSVLNANGWLSYNASSQFTLSQVNGSKTVYAWVKDAVGNESAAFTATIQLDFGSPPIVTLTSPSAGQTYSPGDTVPIEWQCTSSNGLAANPITKIQYTTDDGSTFVAPAIATNLQNNLTATTGSYNWTLPAGVTTFRILLSCKSNAGVVATTFSQPVNTGGWSIFMGDPWYGITNVNASIAKVSSTTSMRHSVVGDKDGNIFYPRGAALMKIDALTGLVTDFAGDPTTSGCTWTVGQSANHPSYNRISSPVILGTNALGDTIYIMSSCSRVYALRIADQVVTASWDTTSAPPSTSSLFLAGGRYLIYSTLTSSVGRSYLLDLGNVTSTPRLINGDGTVLSSAPSVGADALQIGNAPFSGNLQMIFATPDAKKVWIGGASATLMYRLDDDNSDGNYVVGAASFPNAPADLAGCFATRFDSYFYCQNRHVGRSIARFNPDAQTWSSLYTLPFTNNDNSGFQGLGSGASRLLSHYSLNAITSIDTTALASSSSYVTLAGQPFSTFGNGSSPAQVAFGEAFDLHYYTGSKKLYVGNKGHLRIVDMTNPTYITSTLFAGASEPGRRLGFNRSETTFTTSSDTCGSRTSVQRFSLSTGSFIHNAMHGACGSTAGFPPADGSTAQTVGNLFNWTTHYNAYNVPVHHTNGLTYFSGLNGTTDVLIFSSDGTTLRWVAGKSGVGGYTPSDHGKAALGASLSNVRIVREITSGTYAGDLMIWDGNLMRRISIASQTAGDACPNGGVAPCIYDVVNYTLAAGFASGSVFREAIYDASTETSNVFGSGVTYYVNQSNEVRKFTPAVTSGAISGATDTAYTFTGTSLTGEIRLTLTPAGLLITQPSKARILKIDP